MTAAPLKAMGDRRPSLGEIIPGGNAFIVDCIDHSRDRAREIEANVGRSQMRRDDLLKCYNSMSSGILPEGPAEDVS
jgi:hypothetical protein